MNNTPGMKSDRYVFGGLEITGFPRREAEAMYHAAEGMSAKEVARTMGISLFTVQDMWKSAQARAGAKNQRHLIAQAFIKGWVRARDTTVCAVLICAVAAASIGDAAGWRKGPTRRGREEHPTLMVTATA